MITASRRASLSMLAHRTRILSSLHAHQLASPSAPDGPPSLHVQRAEDDVTSGRAARCSASACEAATWTCSSTTARELPVLSGFCILLLNGAPPPHCPTTAGTACARQLGSSPASLSAAACMHAQSRAPAAHAPRCYAAQPVHSCCLVPFAGSMSPRRRARSASTRRLLDLAVISRRAVHALCSYELCYEPHNEAHNGPAAAMSLLIVVLTSGVSIMRSDVSPGGAISALLAFHYEHFPHNEAHSLTSVLTAALCSDTPP